MGRRAKPAKVKADAKRPRADKTPKEGGAKVRDLEKRLAEARRREAAALEQQTATSEILRVISSSPGDIQPVFDAIAANAARLCDAVNGLVIRFDGQLLHLAAHHNVDPERLAAVRQAYPRPPSRGALSGRAILTRAVVHVPDVSKDPEYTLPAATTIGYRSVLAVPMMHEGVARGTILVARDVVAPFSDTNIALIQTFADQAVIAIENVRLFKELEARNRDLSESLDQQTATSEILRVISSSPTDVQPVFDTIVASAVRLCSAHIGAVYQFDGELLHLAAHYNFTTESLEALRSLHPRPPQRDLVSGRAILERAVVQIEDVRADPQYLQDVAHVSGWRSMVAVPMLREGVPTGAIVINRDEPGPFADTHIALLQTFADQAVIAIENVRLFTELEQKNSGLTEALEQQTATAEILQVISSSPTDIQPVLDAVAANAARLCDSMDALIFRVDGDVLRLVASYGPLEAIALGETLPINRELVVGSVVLDLETIHLPDLFAVEAQFPRTAALARRQGYRTTLATPLLREGVALGAIVIRRAEVRPFTPTHVKLLQTFADQAVIAIENVRLFTELEARTHDLTRSVGELRALGEVGQAISSTLDLQAVLSTIVARATQLAGADAGVIYEYDEQREVFMPRATEHLEAAIVETMLSAPVRKGEGATGRLADVPEPIQVPDILEAPAESRVRGALVHAGYRALLAVPLVREDHLLGGLTVLRKATGAFTPEVVELLQTFATQSSLAIQNARLFLEIEDKSRQLEAASQHKSEFLANMSHELRTPLNAIIGFSEVLTERMFGELNEKQDEYLKDIYASGQHLLSLINDILDLSKIEAGRMELEPTDFDLPSAIDNALTLVRERAGRRSIALGRVIDERVGTIRADERKVKQVVLNLLSNAIKFTPEGGRIDVRAAVNDGMVEVSVADTGVGIAPEDQEAVFEEFRQVGTADKKVEGTGLGLALSRKFIELHGGRIWVKSQVGEGSTFTFTVPLRRSE
jgi:two-component system, NtrC family, sensor kinase